MKFKGHGIVWDADNNCILCRFKDGELVTRDERVIKILQDKEYQYEELEDEVDETDISELTVKELKQLLDEKGIEYEPKAKKEDLIKLLEGAE